MTTLIVVPMRAGSVGLPNKHLRSLGGVPVARRVLETLYSIPDAKVVVTTDDPAIEALLLDRSWGNGENRLWVRRPIELAHPTTPLDPVVWHAIQDQKGDIIATMQATSPLLGRETILECIRAVRDHGYDTALTVRDDRHLRWEGPLETAGHRHPYRANRQDMPPAWRETGGCLVTKAEYVTPRSRFGPRVKLIPVTGPEAVDLDTPEDWAVAEIYVGMTTREELLARVLADPPNMESRGVGVLLSAWDEGLGEYDARRLYVQHTSAISRLEKPHGPHTYAEAQTVIANLRANETDVVLMTSAYHQLRVFLTFLRVLQERSLEQTVRLWNAPAPSRIDKLREEWEKITQYQARGHVAHYDEALNYLNWRDTCRCKIPSVQVPA